MTSVNPYHSLPPVAHLERHRGLGNGRSANWREDRQKTKEETS